VCAGFQLTEAKERRRHRDAVKSLARALAAEIKAATDRYERAVGRHIQGVPEGQALDMSAWRAYGQYFAVYLANCGRIGELPERAMERLVVFVEEATGHLEGLNNYAEACRRLKEYDPTWLWHGMLVEWFRETLKPEYELLRRQADEVLRELKAAG
jgi:hypothetical protein